MNALLLVLATLLIVLANAFFVASEFAIVKVRPARLEELARGGDGRARRALAITRRLDEYLSTAQLGVTLASLGLGWIGEPSLAWVFEAPLAWIGAPAGAAHAAAAAVAFLAITSLHSVVGELAPKWIAIARAERIALAFARPLHLFFLLGWPLVWLLSRGANAFVRVLGLLPARDEEVHHVSEELRGLLAHGHAGLDPALRSTLVRVFDLGRRTARHVMTLRSDVSAMRAAMTVDEAIRLAADAGWSRYPVLDQAGAVLGYVHLRDLFEVLAGRREAGAVADLLRKPIFASEDTPVERLRLEMQARQIPIAIVTSRDGEFVGIVTIEDLLEEIVGEIRDETDVEVPPIHRRGGGVVEVDGRVLLADLQRDAGIVLEPEVKAVETLGGYVLARLARPARPGDRVACERLAVVVTEVAGRRVRRARIVPAAGPP